VNVTSKSGSFPSGLPADLQRLARAIDAHIETRRRDQAFIERLRERHEQERELLKRLVELVAPGGPRDQLADYVSPLSGRWPGRQARSRERDAASSRRDDPSPPAAAWVMTARPRAGRRLAALGLRAVA
jgi:hypothetical protein